jgi:hypothetical protein
MSEQRNVNSLANLKMPKRKREGRGYRYKIPQEKVDELFSALADGYSIKKASEKCDICFETANRYYKQGDAKRGIQPLQKRLTIFQERISEKMNILLEEQRMERINTVRTVLSDVQESILNGSKQDFFDVKGNKISVYDAKGNEITNIKKYSIRDLERMMKLEAFLCGGITTKETERKLMSAEQISALS